MILSLMQILIIVWVACFVKEKNSTKTKITEKGIPNIFLFKAILED